MTTVEVAQHAPHAAAPSKVSAPSEIAAEALASSSALFSEHARCEWELLLTALTVVGGDDSAEGEGSGEAAAGNASSSAGNGQPSPAPPSPSFPSLASAAARGDYSLAFATPEARRILLVSGEKCGDEEEDEDEAARRYWSSVADACTAASSPSPSASLERLALGASALLAFVQAAFTGPELELGTPRELAEGRDREEEEGSQAAAAAAAASPLPPGGLPLSALDAAALEASGTNGEAADPRVKGAQFLAVAVSALLSPLGLSDGGSSCPSPPPPSALAAALSRLPPTWSLWALRAACARQRVLGAPAAATRDALDLLAPFAAAAVELGASSSAPLPSSSSPSPSSSLSSPSSPTPPLSAAQARLAAAGCALEAAACRLELRESGSSSGGGSGGGSGGRSGESGDSPLAGAAFLREAAAALGVRVSVTGALGVRTIYQEDARAQLVVRVSRLGGGGGRGAGEEGKETDDFVAVAGGDDVSRLFGLGAEEEGSPPPPSSSSDAAAASKGGLSGLAAEKSEVLTAPRLQGGGGGGGDPGSKPAAANAAAAAASAATVDGNADAAASPSLAAPLTPPVQALLLLHASAVRRGTADDGLRAWRAAPYVEALSFSSSRRQPQPQPQPQPQRQQRREEGGEGEGNASLSALSRSRWAVAACAALARARHELSRPRTRERALLAFERLASAQEERAASEEEKGKPRASSSASAAVARRRVPLALATPLPPSHRARKEAADALLSAGLVSEALDIYERVEAWEASALCHRLLGHAEQARATLEARVEAATKSTSASSLLLPALLCSLGDVTGESSRYEQAWERSRGRCARAQRSLARSASARKDWAQAAAAWDLALALNPIHGDGWFARGYCALKLGDDAGAALAFSRAAAEEPENGEAWNNLAAVHLRAERWRPALSALSQAVKLRKSSWQTWHNFAQAALAVGEGASAARGVAAVVELTDGRGVADGALLLELARFVADASSSGADAAAKAQESACGEEREPHQQVSEGAAATEEEAAGGALLSQLTLDDDFDSDFDGDDEEGEGPAPALSSRGLSSLRAAVGRALRLAAASAACASRASTWHALAIFHDSEPADGSHSSMTPGEGQEQQQQQQQLFAGSRAAAREARLKRVAVLSGGTAWRSDAPKFDEFASAASDLGRAEARAAAEKRRRKEEDGDDKASAAVSAGGGKRELASARMLLKGVVATGRDRFAEAPAFAEAAEALEEVERELKLLVEAL